MGTPDARQDLVPVREDGILRQCGLDVTEGFLAMGNAIGISS